MKFTICFVLLVALLGSSHSSSRTNISFDSILDDITNAVNNAVSKLEELLQTNDNQLNNQLAAALNKLNETAFSIQVQIKKYMDQATEIGDGVRACLEDASDKVTQLVNDAQTNVNTCVDDTRERVRKIIDDAQAEMVDFKTPIKDLTNEFSACDGFICRGKVISKAVTVFSESMVKVGAIISRTVENVGSATTDLPMCIATAVNDLSNGINPIYNEVQQCLTQ